MAFHMTHSRAGYLKPASMKEATNHLIQTGEVFATAGFFSALTAYNAVQGKAPTERMPAVAGIPADLLTGVALHAVMLMGALPAQYGSHVNAVANGALASYAVHLGSSVGLNLGRGAAGTPESARADAMAKDGSYQVRIDPAIGGGDNASAQGWRNESDYADPFLASLAAENPHMPAEQVMAIYNSR